ncbi:MAG: NUDIX hydrolase [Thermoleophilaceae bacterium]
MERGRPAPGEELNEGDETPARQAASVIVLRGGSAGAEVLLVQRNPEARFMGGAWVFPGGSHQPGDRDLRDTGLRELDEEASIRLETRDALVPFSRWITPAAVKIRFDTHFFVVAAPPACEPAVDGAECVALRWLRPADALAAHARNELMLVFPTIKHLEQLAQHGSVEETIASARGREVIPVQPRIVTDDGTPRVLLPGEPGFGER